MTSIGDVECSISEARYSANSPLNIESRSIWYDSFLAIPLLSAEVLVIQLDEMKARLLQVSRDARMLSAQPLIGLRCAGHQVHTFQRPSASLTVNVPPQSCGPRTVSRSLFTNQSKIAEKLEGNADTVGSLGSTSRMPEFSLGGKVVLVSGAARGLGLTQAEALLEAGATVYALDRLSEPSPDFYRVQKRAAEELGTSLEYRQIDVRDNEGLNKVVSDIGAKHGRMDGLIAAAGIQQETTALDYTAKDANMMLEVNVTGVFMTSQAVAKQMIKFGSGGSIVMIASMSGTIANRVTAESKRLRL